MAPNRTGARASLRIIAAITSKDILDALRNKTIFTLMLGLAFMMLSSQALPFLLKLRSVPKAAVYDPTKSAFVETAASSDGIAIRRFSSQEEMEVWVSESSEIELGLLIPENVDQMIEAGRSIALDGFVLNGADRDEISESVGLFEERLSDAAGIVVSINISERRLFPEPNASGRPFMASMSFVVAVVMVGTFLVPYLMVEEKENHTLDTLLISPARYSEVVLGKALAGSFYCVAAATVILLFNSGLVHLWSTAALALVCGAFFTVSVGLLMGITFDNPASLNLWLGLLMIVLLIPIFLADTMGSNFPPIVRSIVTWIPTVGMARLFKASFVESAPLSIVLPNVGLLLAAAALSLSLVVWRVRQLDQ